MAHRADRHTRSRITAVLLLVMGSVLAMGIVLVPDASTSTADAQVPLTWQNSNVTQVDVGGSHTCAIQNGVLFCWGAGTQGQLGFLPPPRPPVLPSPTDQSKAVRVTPFGEFTNTHVTTVSASGASTCAIEHGKVFCWGANGSGQVGIGTFTSRVDTPRKVLARNGFQNSGNVTAVGTSGSKACAIEGGVVYCWGANGLGGVGNGSTTGNGTHPNVPQRVADTNDFTNSGVTAIAVGLTVCAIKNVNGGELFCWGAGSSGQMGNGTSNNANPSPVKVGWGPDGFANNNVASVSSTSVYVCAVRAESPGKVMYCWGNGGYGNLGVQPVSNLQSRPRRVTPNGGMNNTAVTSQHVAQATCAVDAGMVYCFGINWTGQVGDGTTTQRQLPTKVSATGGMANNGSVTMVSAEEGHACAIELASVFCWGKNDKGQMGNGTTGGNLLSPQNASAGPGAPIITAATVGTTTATVTLSAGPGAAPTGYVVTASASPASTSVCTPVQGSTTCSAWTPPLEPGTVYTFNAVATSGQAVSQPSSGVTATTGAVTVPGSPGVVAGNGQLQVTPVPGGGGGTPTGFIAYASPGGGTCTVLSPAASCTITQSPPGTPLTNGTVYTVTTAAFNEAGQSGPSGGTTVTVGATVQPDPPTITVGNQSATVSVNASTSGGTAAYYTVTASAVDSPAQVRTCTITPPDTSCTFTGLTNGRNYTFTTSATNLAGTSPVSDPQVRLVDILPIPLAPTVELGSGGATVSVSRSLDGGAPQSYAVYMSPDGLSCSVLTPPTTSSCFIPGLTPGALYTVTVTATNGMGTSSATPAQTFLFSAPGAPGITVDAVGLGSVTVSVSPTTSGGPPATYVVYVGPRSCTVTAPDTWCAVTGLDGPPTVSAYTATVSATNGRGTATNTVGTLVKFEAPAAPTPGAVEVGFQSATVSVTPVTTSGMPSSYTVTASAVGEPPQVATCTVAAPGTSCTVPGLTNGRTYEFTAGASNVFGASATSVATSSALVDVIPIPLAPTVVVGQSTLTVSVSASPAGGSTDSFTVYAEPGGHTCTVLWPTASACVIPNGGPALVDGTLYTVTTTATNSKGTSTSSPSTSALFNPPSTPSVGDLVLGVTSVTVSVVPGPEGTSGPASFFTVFVGPNGGTCTVTPPAATSCMVPGLTPGQEYTVTVSATNGKGISQPSEPATARLILPPTPVAPVVAVVDPTSVFVMVIPPAPPETPTSFTVATTTSAGAGPTCVITPPEVTCTLENLNPNTQYAISTVVTNAYGSSPTGSATTVLMAAPATPGVPVLVPGNREATVTIQPGTGGGIASLYTVTALPGPFECFVESPATSCVLEGLTNDVQYTVTVRASNSIGGSSESATVTVTPRAPLLPLDTTTTTTTRPATTTVPTTRPPTTTVPATRPPTTTTQPPRPVAADPATGVLPELPPGELTVVDNGVSIPVEVEVVNNAEVVLSGTGFELRLVAECTSGCGVTTTLDGRPVIELEQGGGVRVTGVGFRPGSLAYVWLFSDPRLLGSVTVAADGTFAGTLPVGGLERGEHTLQVNGISAAGVQRSANLGVLVNQADLPTPGPGRLPATGNDGSQTLLTIALLMMLTGGVTLVRRRPIR